MWLCAGDYDTIAPTRTWQRPHSRRMLPSTVNRCCAQVWTWACDRRTPHISRGCW